MEEPTELFESISIEGDRGLNMQTIQLIPCPYTDIITEFADVEIFLISVDSLLLELCAHSYHNWTLGGQTAVLTGQLKQFLCSLEQLNAKFKLVVFTDMASLFQQDTYLRFLHPFLLAYLATSKWADDIESFKSPLDPRWNNYLHQLTPSFMLMSLDNASKEVFPGEIDFSSRFISIAFQLINEAIPIVLFNGFTINYTSVMAFRLSTVPLSIDNFQKKLAIAWPEIAEEITQATNEDLVNCKSIDEFLALSIRNMLRAEGAKDEELEHFCIAALISSLVCPRLGTARRYPETEEDRRKGPSPAANDFRRKVLGSAKDLLKQITKEPKPIKFALDELWDGRMVLNIYRKIASAIEVLPLRLQEKFAGLFTTAGLSAAVPTDLTEKLLDPLTPSENPTQQLRIARCQLYTVQNDLLDEYIPELRTLLDSQNNSVSSWTRDRDYAAIAADKLGWKFKPIDDPLMRREEKQREAVKKAMEDAREARRMAKGRQNLSKWYQLFSDSLEGQGGQLLVDFSRVVKMPTIVETQNGKEEDGPGKKPGAGKKEKEAKSGAKKGGKPGAGGLSKKDQILKQNRDAMVKQQVESDKQKIEYATSIKTNTLNALDDLLRRLELDESKAFCIYQKTLRYAENFTEQLGQLESIDQKREAALGLVESIKSIFVKYFTYLDEQQRDKILYFWASLGFGRPESAKRRPDKQFNLDIDLVYYQLKYGGRLVDVLSDPAKDDRVTGFRPDAWQRKMLDAVDRDKSALIVAPTSAGKTFVSYYCIEKVLRKSNEDVVVYISPSKALTNQIVGSVYARFRGKAMSGGKVLYGIFTNEVVDNSLNCQVLVTIPDCFEQILLSTNPRCQQFVSRIKYVILDEVHCINQKDTQGYSLGHIWEHIFLLIRCPFLALSATISNIEALRDWLQTAEQLKPTDGTPAREVEMITYDERWSELELALQHIRDCPKGLQFENDEEQFMRGASMASNFGGEEQESGEEGEERPTAVQGDGTALGEASTTAEQPSGQQKPVSRIALEDISSAGRARSPAATAAGRAVSPAPSNVSHQSRASWQDVIQYFNPFAVYKLEKLRMFGIPADQRLTARQVLELYEIMGGVDTKVKDNFEPVKYFRQCHPGEDAESAADGGAIWLNRTDLRKLESALKDLFVEWMNKDKAKIDQIFARLEAEVKEEFEKRSKPFNMRNSALYNIMPLMDQLKRKDQIPALCFNDDREMCEHMAIRVFNELQKREDIYKASEEFQRKYNFKAEEKAQKLAKRKRDEEERAAKRKGKRTDEEGNRERFEKEDEGSQEGSDVFAILKRKMNEDLNRFKLTGRWTDEDIYEKCVNNLIRRDRRSTKQLLRLFERGIGFHHDGLANAERSAVEVLFRRGFLGIVFSTSTLALGMNLPCKTVIFGIDTPKLTPLQFRQMSGRAGRRGFDPAGSVIFMSLPTSKIRRLLTASLATLRGNVPFTTAFMLRLFAYVNGEVQSPVGSGKEQPQKGGGGTTRGKLAGGRQQQQLLDSMDVQNEAVRRKAVLTLLQAPFALKTREGQHQGGVFGNLLKFLTFFNVQLLRQMQLLDEKCAPRGFAQFAVHLSQYEPGNLVFIRLLQEGVLHRYIKVTRKYDLMHEEQRANAKEDLITILAHIFTQKLVPIHASTENGPILPPMHEEIEGQIGKHNEEVGQLLTACLQMSSVSRQVENPELALSGCTEPSLQLWNGQMDFVPAFSTDFQLDERLVPMVQLRRMDHRRRPICKNSYVLDFWRNPDPEALRTHNLLSVSERWYLLNEFNKLLDAIASGLKDIASPKDDLYKLIVQDEMGPRPGIAPEFDDKFRVAFKMRRKEGADAVESTRA